MKATTVSVVTPTERVSVNRYDARAHYERKKLNAAERRNVWKGKDFQYPMAQQPPQNISLAADTSYASI